ncbi:response regulator [Chitinibacter bivalviorum]|uniref:histidine kinase n=1 Tax=Chitinibacter bivalviorum TaxID=2739434 RepID=A0A7H9BLR4_9NEIS|nr:ATP-binding protein [Chitinibacter bivalviorum]QLG89545.1 response regulator [Chitinibacter bivalviorum]
MTRFKTILSLICLVVLSNLSLMVYFEVKQKNVLESFTRFGMDNQLWQFFQFSREFQKLNEVVSHFNPSRQDELTLRFDIYIGRIHLLSEKSIDANAMLQDKSALQTKLKPLQDYVLRYDKLVANAAWQKEDWQQFVMDTHNQLAAVDGLIAEAREQDSKAVADYRAQIQHLGELRLMLGLIQIFLLIVFAAMGLYAYWQNEISRKIQAETMRNLAQAKGEADVANAAKSRFLAHISHEIRTPLTSVLGYAERLARKPLGTEALREVQHISDSGTHLLDLLNKVLDFSKSGQNKLTLLNETLDFRVLKKELESMFQLMAKQKGLQFQVILSDDLPEYLSLDVGKFRQILINLIANALKFTTYGFVRVNIYGKPQEAHYQLYATVWDSGCGIEPADQARIFSPFEQSERGQLVGGTGLGLALSRDYARLMQGDIVFCSKPGRGSEFTCYVATQIVAPPLSNPATCHPSEAELAQSLASGLATQKILIVEDQQVNREMICAMLNDCGVQTLTANNGLEAIEQVAQHPEIDQILMDYQMPKMDGIQAATVLRDQGYQKPIYLLSASVLDDELAASGRVFDGQLLKPYQLLELLQLLNHGHSQVAVEQRQPLNAELAKSSLGERYLSLCQKGLARIADLEQDYQQAIAAHEVLEAQRHAHSAKGIALQIGAQILAEHWTQLEANPVAPEMQQLVAARQDAFMALERM